MQMHAAARVGAASDHFADIDDEMDADEAEAFAAAEAAAEAEADAMAKELLGAEELLAGVTPADHLVKAVVAGSVTPAKTPLFIDPQLQLSDVIAPHYPAASALSEPDVGPADPEVRRSKREARPSMKHSDTTNDDDLAGGRAGGGGGASGVKSRQASGGGGGGAAKASAVASGGGKSPRRAQQQQPWHAGQAAKGAAAGAAKNEADGGASWESSTQASSPTQAAAVPSPLRTTMSSEEAFALSRLKEETGLKEPSTSSRPRAT